MSYTSHSEFPPSARLATVRDVINALGYERYPPIKELPDQTDGYFWFDKNDYRSWVGVELQVYRTAAGLITVDTRSREGRSDWDLLHQNRTIRLLRDCFGGSFETDAGKNRYYRPDGKAPSPLASGCYIARWTYNNALVTARVYLSHRNLPPPNTKLIKLSPEFADMTPVIISNNLVLPYLFAVWEEYFRATFAAALKYSPQREAALKRARFTSDQLERVLAHHDSVERAVAETFSFQRPSAIASLFKLLDPKLDLGAAFRRPYRKRKQSLYDSLEALVERRNAFVHSGKIGADLDGPMLNRFLSDFEVAADRAYDYLGRHYSFRPIRDY